MLAIPAAVELPLRVEEDVIRIGKSRVTLQAVIADYLRGASAETIAQHYPAVTLSDIYLVIGYYLNHRAEVDAYVAEQEYLAAQARQAYEADYPDDPLRERLREALAKQRKANE